MSCHNCLRKETIEDCLNDNFTEIENENYCDICYENMKDVVIFCEGCFEFGFRNENFTQTYVEVKIEKEPIYYHIKCLPDYWKCPLCKEFLNEEEEECIDCFVGYNLQIEHHTRCIEEAKNNNDFCEECNVSFRTKCEGENCENRFLNCYNENCEAYNYDDENNGYTDGWFRYPGWCSKKCYNKSGI